MMSPVHYPDKIARLICILVWSFFFRLIGDPAPLGDLFVNPSFYMDVAVVMIVNAILWESNQWLIRKMDARYSWATQPLQRLIVQGGLGFVWTASVIAVFSLVYNNLILARPAPFSLSITIANDVPIGCLFFLLMHMGYTMYWMVAYHRQVVANLKKRIVQLADESMLADRTESQNNATLRTLLVNHGKAKVPVYAEQVAYVFIVNDVSIVKTSDNQSFTVDATLEQLSERLSQTDFFRLNRQLLVNRNAILRVENEGTGRLLLQLRPGHTSDVAVSRRRVSDFRQWMEL